MNEQKLCGLIGLAVRARQTESGMEACRILVSSGKCGVLLIDGDAGANTRKKASDICTFTRTPLKILPAGMIATATGKNNMVIGLKNGGFAEEILRLIPDENDN